MLCCSVFALFCRLAARISAVFALCSLRHAGASTEVSLFRVCRLDRIDFLFQLLCYVLFCRLTMPIVFIFLCFAACVVSPLLRADRVSPFHIRRQAFDCLFRLSVHRITDIMKRARSCRRRNNRKTRSYKDNADALPVQAISKCGLTRSLQHPPLCRRLNNRWRSL